MGVFFSSEPLVHKISLSIEDALATRPEEVPDARQEAARRTNVAFKQGGGKFSGSRLLVAVILLVFFIAAGIYSEQNNLESWSSTLLHITEVYAGGVVGIVFGEFATRQGLAKM